jgi:hypothetical protein
MTDHYNPTSAELAQWLRERSKALRWQVEGAANADAFDYRQETLGMAEQLERCAEALETAAHGPWMPEQKWAPVEGESVLLKLQFDYRNAPPLIHYDVGRWTRRGGGDWDRARVGKVLAVAALREDRNGK